MDILIKNIIIYFVIVSSCIVDEFMFIYILCKLDKTHFVKKYRVIVFLSIITLSIILNLIIVVPKIQLLISIIISTAIATLIFKHKIIDSCILSFIYWISIKCIDMFGIAFVLNINKIILNYKNINSIEIKLTEVIIAKVVSIILIIILLRSINFKKNDFTNNILIFSTILINISFAISIFSQLTETRYFDIEINYTRSSRLFFMMILIFIAYNTISIIFMRKIMLNSKEKMENEYIKEQMRIYHKHYDKLILEKERLKKINHDIKNHIICLKEIVRKEDRVSKYVEEIENIIYIDNNTFSTGNMILDILINEKYNECQKLEIDFISDIYNIEKLDFISSIDICTIFGNLLDNSIEACKKVKYINKKIEIKGNIVNNFFVLKIYNTKEGEIKKLDNRILTTKEDVEYHGIGLKSIKDIINKYNAKLSLKYDEFSFNVTIIFPLNS